MDGGVFDFCVLRTYSGKIRVPDSWCVRTYFRHAHSCADLAIGRICTPFPYTVRGGHAILHGSIRCFCWPAGQRLRVHDQCGITGGQRTNRQILVVVCTTTLCRDPKGGAAVGFGFGIPSHHPFLDHRPKHKFEFRASLDPSRKCGSSTRLMHIIT